MQNEANQIQIGVCQVFPDLITWDKKITQQNLLNSMPSKINLQTILQVFLKIKKQLKIQAKEFTDFSEQSKQDKNSVLRKLKQLFDSGVEAVIFQYDGHSRIEKVQGQDKMSLNLSQSGPKKPQQLQKNDYISLDEIINIYEQAIKNRGYNKKISFLILLDTCHSGHWVKQFKDRFKQKIEENKQLDKYHNWYKNITFMCSSLYTQQSRSNNHDGSCYTHILAKYFQFLHCQKQPENIQSIIDSVNLIRHICGKIYRQIFQPEGVKKLKSQHPIGFINDDYFKDTIPIFVHSYGEIIKRFVRYSGFLTIKFKDKLRDVDSIGLLLQRNSCLNKHFLYLKEKVYSIQLIGFKKRIKNNQQIIECPQWRILNGEIFQGQLDVNENNYQLKIIPGNLIINSQLKIIPGTLIINSSLKITGKINKNIYQLIHERSVKNIRSGTNYKVQTITTQELKEPKKGLAQIVLTQHSYTNMPDKIKQQIKKQTQYTCLLKLLNLIEQKQQYFEQEKLIQLLNKKPNTDYQKYGELIKDAKQLLKNYTLTTISQVLDQYQNIQNFTYLKGWSSYKIELTPYILPCNQSSVQILLAFKITQRWSNKFYSLKTILLNDQFNYQDQKHFLRQVSLTQLDTYRTKQNKFALYDKKNKKIYILLLENDIRKIFPDEKTNYLLNNQRFNFNLQFKNFNDFTKWTNKQVQKIKDLHNQSKLKLIQKLIKSYRKKQIKNFPLFNIQELFKLYNCLQKKEQFYVYLQIEHYTQLTSQNQIKKATYIKKYINYYKKLDKYICQQAPFQLINTQASYFKDKMKSMINQILKEQKVRAPQFILHNKIKKEQSIIESKSFTFQIMDKSSKKIHTLWQLIGMRYNQLWKLDSICFIYIDSKKVIHIDEKHEKLEINQIDSIQAKEEKSYRIQIKNINPKEQIKRIPYQHIKIDNGTDEYQQSLESSQPQDIIIQINNYYYGLKCNYLIIIKLKQQIQVFRIDLLDEQYRQRVNVKIQNKIWQQDTKQPDKKKSQQTIYTYNKQQVQVQRALHQYDQQKETEIEKHTEYNLKNYIQQEASRNFYQQ